MERCQFLPLFLDKRRVFSLKILRLFISRRRCGAMCFQPNANNDFGQKAGAARPTTRRRVALTVTRENAETP
jgi:hypothetical protein